MPRWIVVRRIEYGLPEEVLGHAAAYPPGATCAIRIKFAAIAHVPPRREMRPWPTALPGSGPVDPDSTPGKCSKAAAMAGPCSIQTTEAQPSGGMAACASGPATRHARQQSTEARRCRRALRAPHLAFHWPPRACQRVLPRNFGEHFVAAVRFSQLGWPLRANGQDVSQYAAHLPLQPKWQRAIDCPNQCRAAVYHVSGFRDESW